MKKYIGAFLVASLLLGCSSGEVRSTVKKRTISQL